MTTDEIAAELCLNIGIDPESNKAFMVKAAIEKALSDDYWWKRYQQCAKDFADLRKSQSADTKRLDELFKILLRVPGRPFPTQRESIDAAMKK